MAIDWGEVMFHTSERRNHRNAMIALIFLAGIAVAGYYLAPSDGVGSQISQSNISDEDNDIMLIKNFMNDNLKSDFMPAFFDFKKTSADAGVLYVYTWKVGSANFFVEYDKGGDKRKEIYLFVPNEGEKINEEDAAMLYGNYFLHTGGLWVCKNTTRGSQKCSAINNKSDSSIILRFEKSRDMRVGFRLLG